jgi:hypothetical protein
VSTSLPEIGTYLRRKSGTTSPFRARFLNPRHCLSHGSGSPVLLLGMASNRSQYTALAIAGLHLRPCRNRAPSPLPPLGARRRNPSSRYHRCKRWFLPSLSPIHPLNTETSPETHLQSPTASDLGFLEPPSSSKFRPGRLKTEERVHDEDDRW